MLACKSNLLGLTLQEKRISSWSGMAEFKNMLQRAGDFIIDREYLQTVCVVLALQYLRFKTERYSSRQATYGHSFRSPNLAP
jgi:hypothetical protein